MMWVNGAVIVVVGCWLVSALNIVCAGCWLLVVGCYFIPVGRMASAKYHVFV